jgi:hypothetical protein
VNAIDALLHERFLDLADLRRLAAELRIGCRAARRRLDPAQPVLVLGDHGFRLAPDGRSYVHERGSTLERVVPVLRHLPR